MTKKLKKKLRALPNVKYAIKAMLMVMLKEGIIVTLLEKMEDVENVHSTCRL